jgi:multidrug resistance efflux pump
MSPDTTTSANPIAAQYSTPATPRRRAWVWLLALVLLVAIGLGAWYWWPKSADTQPPAKGRFDQANRALPVVAAPAKKGSIECTSTHSAR